MLPQIRYIEANHTVENVEVGLQMREVVREDRHLYFFQYLGIATIRNFFIFEHYQKVTHSIIHALTVRSRISVLHSNILQ